MRTKTKVVNYPDHFVFKWCAESLEGKNIEDIAAFYVDKFIFKNGEYFKMIVAEYNLPNDFLRMHKRITELAQLPFES